MLIKDILKIKNSKLINGNTEIDSFSINTNETNGKTMFFPLKGNTNGHNYIINGVKNGIAGFFVEPGYNNIIEEALKINNSLVIIEVPNTEKALVELARIVRNSLNIPVIALTGSFGKTSQREMIYSVLKTNFRVLSTKGNYNNNIGMPLTLVNYKNEDIVLLELGSNHMGEIAFLRDICKPTISLVTNVGTAHIGNFKSIKNTLKEKMSISKDSAFFFRNMDDNMIKKTKIKVPNVIDYGIDEVSNIIYGKKTRYTYSYEGKDYKITINSDIKYLINYSLVAVKIGCLLGMDMKSIIKGVESFKCAPSRMEKKKFGKYFIIDDCYNASFETMISGLKYFNEQECANKIVILGDILELGKSSSRIHMDIAKTIVKEKYKFDNIYLIGPEMKKVYNYLNKNNFNNIYYYKSVDEVDSNIVLNKNIYIKASHGIGLSKLVPENK